MNTTKDHETAKPLKADWFMKFVEACGMNAHEYSVFSRIWTDVHRYDSDKDRWDRNGYCDLSIQSIADTFSMSRETVQRSINVLELAGVISVQRHCGSTHTITLIPNIEWVATDFRKLRASVKGK